LVGSRRDAVTFYVERIDLFKIHDRSFTMAPH